VPRWHVQDLVPLVCPPESSVGSVCERAWLDIASRIGAQLVPGEDEPVQAAPARDGSGCGLGAPPSRARGVATTLGALLMALAALAKRRRA
jgi:hypothetical protein